MGDQEISIKIIKTIMITIMIIIIKKIKKLTF